MHNGVASETRCTSHVFPHNCVSSIFLYQRLTIFISYSASSLPPFLSSVPISHVPFSSFLSFLPSHLLTIHLPSAFLLSYLPHFLVPMPVFILPQMSERKPLTYDEILRQLVEDELQYVRHLNLILKVFMEPFQDRNLFLSMVRVHPTQETACLPSPVHCNIQHSCPLIV